MMVGGRSFDRLRMRGKGLRMMVGGKNEINQDAIALGRFSASLTLNLAYVTFRAVNGLTPAFPGHETPKGAPG